jgi:Lrp/AsnC family leucine-responsive transcriptional regulator
MAKKNGLSPVEKRLVYHLVQNGVKNEKEIAEALKLSPSTISYKLKKLEKAGTIAEYRYRLNYSKIGLNVMAWVFFKMHRTNVPVEEFLDQLLEHQPIYAALNLTGSDDFAIKVFVEDLPEITETLIDLEKRFKDYIKSSSVYFVSKAYKRHQVILEEKHHKKTKLSKLDLKLLKHALKNSRFTLKDFARQAKVHRNTVSKRWQRLLDEGVVLKKSMIVSPDYFDEVKIAFRAIVSYHPKTGETENLAQELVKLPEVHELVITPSHYSVICVVRTRNLDEFYRFHKQVYSSPALKDLIENSVSSVIMKGKTQSLSKLTAKMAQGL